MLTVFNDDTYNVYTDLDGDASGSAPAPWLNGAIDQDDFRAQIHAAAATLTGTTNGGIVIYYPASWGDFTYSIGYPVAAPTIKLELTNGVSVTTVAPAGGPQTADEGTYKKVTISSRQARVYVD